MHDLELQLVIGACRAAFGGGDIFHFADPSKRRWERVARLAERHRVTGLVWQGLADAQHLIPPATASKLNQSASAGVATSLRMAVECGRLRALFDAASIDVLFVKGATIGALAYPDPFLRMSVDIDLLVARRALPTAAKTLRLAGYLPVVPAAADDDRLNRWHRSRKESVWRHPGKQLQIDLHTRLADQPGLLAAVGIQSPRQMVSVAKEIALPTLARDELFAYLCVHGASSAWFRLKWICDLAALLRDETPQKIGRLYDRSQQLGAGRAAAQALLLVDTLFAIGPPEPLRKRLNADPVNRWLVGVATRQLTSETEPTERILGTMSIHLSQPMMLYGVGMQTLAFAREIRAAIGWGLR